MNKAQGAGDTDELKALVIESFSREPMVFKR